VPVATGVVKQEFTATIEQLLAEKQGGYLAPSF
jgi:hypothetical protein